MTSGICNTALGSFTLSRNTAGTTVGLNVLRHDQIAISKTAVGFSAFAFNDSDGSRLRTETCAFASASRPAIMWLSWRKNVAP
jgi:hypothetical protein